MKNMVKCEICMHVFEEKEGGGGREKNCILIHKGTRDNNKIDVYKCKNCGTKFLPAAECNADYENGFMHKESGLSQYDIKITLKSLEKDNLRRFNMVKELCAHKKILDFGCGFGGFLEHIKGVAEESCGVELGKEERDYLTSNGIMCVKEIEEYNKKFDVITLFHTFEHLSNPFEWLIKFTKYLTEDGMLIMEVPNADDVLLSLYESDSFADFTYWSAHLFLYTSDSLSQLINHTKCYDIICSTQLQRYSIANHFYWLAKKLPGGHEKWKCLDNEALNHAYEERLKKMGMCDTLYMILKVKKH